MINMLVDKNIKLTKEEIKNKIIAFPTDTVFGVGALIDDLEAIDKIYELKHRDYSKPLAILASSIDDIIPYVKEVTEDVKEIMNKYWPGALTIIFNKNENVSDKITAGFKTIAFRIPNCKISLDILKQTGPLATTSVNISGNTPLNDYQEINKYFGDNIDFIVSENVSSSNISSTIIDVTSNKIKIIRQGQIKIV